LHGQSSAADLVKENNFVEDFNEHAKDQCCGAGASRSSSCIYELRLRSRILTFFL